MAQIPSLVYTNDKCMELHRSDDSKTLTVCLIGEVDTTNASEIEERLLKETVGINELIFDLKHLEYISSAGLHVLLMMQKIMKKQGTMTVINVNEEVMEIFKVTGFVRLLNISRT